MTTFKTQVTTLTMRKIVQIIEELQEIIDSNNHIFKELPFEKAVEELKHKTYLEDSLSIEKISLNEHRKIIGYKDLCSFSILKGSDGLILDKAAITVYLGPTKEDGSKLFETISYDYCKKQLNDLTLREQENFLIGLDLKPLETAISNYLGIKINFISELYLPVNTMSELSPKLSIHSQDLKEYCGILGSQYEEIKLETFGRVGFYISNKDGLQHISFPDIHYAWTYIDGGSNGHIAFRVNYDFRNNHWDIQQVK